MQHLDLQHLRCPMALVTLKQKLLTLDENEQVSVLFSNTEAMKDICLFLIKKNYVYEVINNTLLINKDGK